MCGRTESQLIIEERKSAIRDVHVYICSDEKQTNYVNRLKEENIQMRRELEKASENIFELSQ
jgi:hypothetical protein